MSDHSRRSWLVTISQTVAGLGLASTVDGATSESAPLPPGLYEASTDHLGHALMSAEQFHRVVPGCPTDYVRPRTGPFTPRFFSPSQFAVVQRIVALLLGEGSEDDSKKDESTVEEVAEWIDLRIASAGGVRDAALQMHPLYRKLSVAYNGRAEVSDTEKADAAATCRDGIAWLARESRARYSDDFVNTRTEQQLALLDDISDQRQDRQLQNAGTRFFELMKSETIRGFYTSRAGLKELDYKGNAFYARSPGCDKK